MPGARHGKCTKSGFWHASYVLCRARVCLFCHMCVQVSCVTVLLPHRFTLPVIGLFCQMHMQVYSITGGLFCGVQGQVYSARYGWFHRCALLHAHLVFVWGLFCHILYKIITGVASQCCGMRLQILLLLAHAGCHRYLALHPFMVFTTWSWRKGAGIIFQANDRFPSRLPLGVQVLDRCGGGYGRLLRGCTGWCRVVEGVKKFVESY